ncbi:DUF255 domain-containing protein [Shewanella benthica]|uniref:thioredoxin domain-containing protein n=1 Tax=Shewanella benthica TaxID=43661 RepID=UPI00187ADB0B|nr:DUF255 domain-containing protein [Shewanella benthica]MBE7213929.1 DUF255 domain-containing protein [Shewanella benthica]MCL1061835.1 DUF255 domain-containing protein [Shewanella benthica]
MHHWLYALLFLLGTCHFNIYAQAVSVEDPLVSATVHSVFEQRREWLSSRDVIDINDPYPEDINSLIYSDSPYLLSHSLQPVNWLEWQASFEQGSGDNNKLLFISIGYSTCHWCHVMAQESFNDPVIASLLNADYVSVKVDREQWPIVDHRFKNALEALKGEAGWPINVILTPDGKIIWIDSYLPKKKFSKVVAGFAKRWNSKPKAIEGLANRLEQQLSSDKVNVDIAKKYQLSNTLWRALLPTKHQEIHHLLQLEQQGQGPRFLRTNWSLGLIEEFLRTGEPALLKLVEQHLQRIILSPTYDGIEGGFHRYAVDGLWQTPHFEKMLYTQANMIRVLAKVYAITRKPEYAIVMAQTRGWVNEWLRQNSGYASALSAISNKREGAYYQLNSAALVDILNASSQSQISAADAMSNDQILLSLTNISRDWRSTKTVVAAREYRQTLVRPLVDEKVLVSWNSMYAIALLEAFDATQEPIYLEEASELLDNLWNNAFVDNTLYRSIFHGKASINAELEDLAWFAVAQMNLSYYQGWSNSISDGKDNGALARGHLLLEQLAEELANEKVYLGLLSQNRDGEIASVKSIVYKALQQGYQLTQIRQYKQLSKQVALYDKRQLDQLVNQYSLVRHQANRFNNINVQRAYFAKGHGKIRASVNKNVVSLAFDLEPGWHINANTASMKRYIPTKVTLLQLNGESVQHLVSYPQAKHQILNFDQSPLALFDGQFEISVTDLDYVDIGNNNQQVVLSMTLQACSNSLCLLPEKSVVFLPLER